MTDNLILNDTRTLNDLKNHMNTTITKTLNINLNLFERTQTEHYKSSYYPYLIKTFINNDKVLI